MEHAVETNCIVIEKAEEHGVRSYIFSPCIVYGKGEGFGNKVSIQTVCVVKAAKALRKVYKVDEGRPELLRKILAGENPGYGKNGYYLASPGSVAWDDLYGAMGTALLKHKLVDDDTVIPASEENVEAMAAALGVPKEFVGVSLGGLCTFTAEHGKQIGWTPQFAAEHILETAHEEVDWILQNL
ncbi:putative nad dependent epimerase dehydratase family protein [Phaeoacremonium minimum UCRPA7]|uniref:Putative nad dependent epimerase dehydratase family protein n=1 Tax=Phaeoacremonium minimum (strain UCR-PA7) TaxID=1286976 RepID=R8BUT4_PHAM7|nr:putative nad dependent epimerase dehydratase family protein [Phaeoacremonium minimum UCRPA7]EOO03070.1 putative nad dependent epimerase dehydratase family protein [Phaeoacremonium minimum UCRPA7]